LRLTKFQIVPSHSAILPAYESLSIHANHINMTKFPSDQDAGYTAVKATLRRWTRLHAIPSGSGSIESTARNVDRDVDRSRSNPPRTITQGGNTFSGSTVSRNSVLQGNFVSR